MIKHSRLGYLFWISLLAALFTAEPAAAGSGLRALQKLHHYEVGYAEDGRVLVLKLINSRNGQAILTAYPHGSDAGLRQIHHHERLNRSQYLKWAKILKRQARALAKPRALAAATTDERKGLGLGFSDTAGYIGGQSSCYQFTTEMNGNQSRLSFSSKQTASTLAGQFNLTASLDLALGFFKANNDFSYSSNYQNTANSGHLAYSAGSLYTANNVLTSVSPYGNQALAAGSFESQCGTDFINSLPVGMLVLGDVSWSSTTSEANQKIEDQLKTDFGFGQLKAAVTVANSVQNSQSEFQFNLTILGGGTEVSLLIENAYSDALDLRNKCLQDLNVTACANFTAVLEKAAIAGIQAFDNKMKPENLPTDLGFLQPFPYGVAGFPQATALGHIPVSKLIKDIVTPSYLKPYQPALQNVLTILSDLSILRNRANYLYGKLYDPVTRTNLFNPFPMRDVANDYLAPLESGYLGLRTNLVTILQNCLGSTQETVADQCKPVMDLTGATTRTFIAMKCLGDPVNNRCDESAFENYIGLQYVGLYNDPKGGFPLDFVYAGNIGTTWATQTGPKPPAGAALIGFVDSKYVFDTNPSATDPWALILAFGQTGHNLLSQAPPPISVPGSFYAIGKSNWAPQNGFIMQRFETLNGCQSQPCPLSAQGLTTQAYNDNNSPGSINLSIFPIQNLFTR